MAKSIEVKAKTVHEALVEACEKLGVDQDQVNVEVLSQGGMFGKAKILVTVKEEEPRIEEVKVEAADSKVADSVAIKSEASKDIPLKEQQTSKHNTSSKTEEHITEKPVSQKSGNKNPSSPKFAKSLAFVEKLVELLETGSTVTSELTDSAFNININGSNVGRLIGKGGEVMNAIQTLVSSVAISNANGENTRVFIDIEGYKEKRGDSLKNLAVKKAEYVKKSGRFVKLDPMNARDRAIIHTILGEIEGIKTYSTGKDPFRCLCIAPADKQ